MAWTTTPLTAGPLAGNSYTMNISGLSGSTNYQYRAYFIVDGTPYYGNILSGTTANIVLYPPTVETGTPAAHPLDNQFFVNHNCVSDKGGACIIEYGLIYSQSATYGQPLTLVCTNYPAHVNKTCCLGDIVLNAPYVLSATGLTPSTITYVRAYAKNAVGINYGDICTKVTADPPVPIADNIDVELNWLGGGSINTSGLGGVYKLFCCTGTLLESCAITTYTKISSASWGEIPANGCYYVDFSAVIAYNNGHAMAHDVEWSDCFGSGIGYSTNCFQGDNSILAIIRDNTI